ncbi:hypothetical protein [Ensifer adhaerens]|uniref:hypothetical protein n=1 Tax=Ensifer adhaerens TaxID=106592 RepID=UPI00098FEC60|nr:hypothetical protein [Ensifer adhaerens]
MGIYTFIWQNPIKSKGNRTNLKRFGKILRRPETLEATDKPIVTGSEGVYFWDGPGLEETHTE